MDACSAAIDAVLREEGGYVNHPQDPGGETNFGICKRSYPHLDIKNLTREDAAAIYRRDYWAAAGCDELPPPLGVVVFDCAVNQGVGAAKRLLAQTHDLDEFLRLRLERYKQSPVWATFGKGWTNRLEHIKAFALTFKEK